MPTAISPPRDSHRGIHLPLSSWLTVMLISLAGPTTAPQTLSGQELEYRFIGLTSHMETWPVEEAKILPCPLPALEPFAAAPTQPQPPQAAPIQSRPTPTRTTLSVTTPTRPPRVTVKWRTDLTAMLKEKASPSTEATEPRLAVREATETDQLPGPSLEDSDGAAEVLVIPRAADNVAAPSSQPPSSLVRNCYQAPPLAALSATIALPAGKLPASAAAQCAAQTLPIGDARLAGAWAGTEFHWSATCLRHRPLYFEEINAERYGYTVSYFLQPAISAARFFATIPALPYKMTVDPPCDDIYTLGHYRPGSCVPRRWNRLPWKLTAGVVETGFIAGMILLIP